MAKIKVRVRTPARMVMVDIEDSATVSDLKALVAPQLGLSSVKTQLSLTPTYTAVLGADANSLKATLSSLGFKNGHMLYTKDDANATTSSSTTTTSNAAVGAGAGNSNASSTTTTTKGAPSTTSTTTTTTSSSASSPASPRKVLTKRCNHGPKGACQHCEPVTQSYIDTMREGPLNKAGGRHGEKSAVVGKEVTGESLEWLCRHRPDQMCTNCAPLKKGEKVELEMLCLHGPEGRCINCLPPDSAIDDRKFITYDEWMEKKRDKCEHNFNAICVNCVPPSQMVYKMKKNCPKHPAWPRGLCSDCAPQPVEAKLQEYRHVDYISIVNTDELSNLIQLFSVNAAAGVHRAAYLYGTIVPDSTYRHGQRAVVHAIYEPPQKMDPRYGLVVLPDKRGPDIDAVAQACGIRRIGWLFTKKPVAALPATGSLANAESVLSPRELWAMAQLQNAHPRSAATASSSGAGGGSSSTTTTTTTTKPGSQFVTVVVRKGPEGYEPKGYMASDTMMALAKEGLLIDPTPTDTKLKMKQPRPNSDDPPAPEFISVSKDFGRSRGYEMDPDAGIVTLEVGGASAGTGRKFKHSSFPIENRSDYGILQSAADVKKQLQRYKSEPLWSRLSDFHLLVYLATMFDRDTAIMTANAVVEEKPIPEGVVLLLDSSTDNAASAK